MPIEFGAAAYRFGHSMVRPSYRANFTSGTGDSTNPTADPFFALVFDATEPDFIALRSATTATTCSAAIPAPRRYIGWQTFFDLGDGQVKNNKKIDTTISSVLFTLPVPGDRAAHPDRPTVLPQRNLLRQLTWGLPSGQAVARAMGVDALSRADLSDIGGVYAPFAASTPLWYYILAEAKVVAGGLNLGPVGGRIVAETLIGLLRADPTSYLSVYPRFQPFLGTDLAARARPRPQHHRQPQLHPRALPPLRRRRHTRHLPLRSRAYGQRTAHPNPPRDPARRRTADPRSQTPPPGRPRAWAKPPRIQRRSHRRRETPDP